MGCSGSKAAEPKAAKAPEGDYQINIERTSDEDKMGLAIVTMSDNTIKINGVNSEGMVPAWNEGMNTAGTPELMVKEGDFIVCVNGIFVDAEAMKKELAQKTLLLTLKRAPAAPEPAADPATDAEPAAADAAAADAEPAAADAVAADAEPAAATAPAEEPTADAEAAEPIAEAAPPTEESRALAPATPAATDTVEITEEAATGDAKEKVCVFC